MSQCLSLVAYRRATTYSVRGGENIREWPVLLQRRLLSCMQFLLPLRRGCLLYNVRTLIFRNMTEDPNARVTISSMRACPKVSITFSLFPGSSCSFRHVSYAVVTFRALLSSLLERQSLMMANLTPCRSCKADQRSLGDKQLIPGPIIGLGPFLRPVGDP